MPVQRQLARPIRRSVRGHRLARPGRRTYHVHLPLKAPGPRSLSLVFSVARAAFLRGSSVFGLFVYIVDVSGALYMYMLVANLHAP